MESTMKERDLSDERVYDELVKYLSGKRYLIILDDVWTDDLWGMLKTVLPDEKNASRVVITTRNLDVALAADRNTAPYKLDYLNEDDSLALLFRKALQQVIQPDTYPSDLVEVAKKLMEKCGRLPLALVVLGGLLSKKPNTCAAWQRVYNTLDWHDDQGKKCTQTLRMSYQELCYEQKQRFLYFAAFPEDHKMSAEHIIRLWIAEGLIPVDGEGTMEDRAEDFLEDLVKRCLVQVIKRSWNGYCKYCSMHDLLRDLAIHEAKEQNFFTVFSKQEDGSQLTTKGAHRVALQSHTPTGCDIHSTNVRSLLCFQGTVPNYHGFTQLRVLVFERIDFQGIKVSKNWLDGLVHLKYLGFRNCELEWRVDYISFNSMKNLETFDCNLSIMMDIYNLSLWEVPTLKHVITGFSDLLCPIKWDNLKNLQTLKRVLLEGNPKLESNVDLRVLKIYIGGDQESWNALKALLSRTKHLVTLAIDCGSYEILFQTVGIWNLSCYETIYCLHLDGKWSRACVPSIEMFPKNLTKLKLKRSMLEEDPMPILERLQCLRILMLHDYTYEGIKMICSTGGFPSLQKLELMYLQNLSDWIITERAMPVLSQLSIEYCSSLSRLPELQNVPSLQELIIRRHLPELETRLQSEDLYKINHIPSVRISNPLRVDDDDV